MAVFPTGFSDLTPSRTSKVLGDTGTQNGNFTVAGILAQIALTDILTQLLAANDVVEDVPANTTAYTITANDKNKTKRFLSTGNCAVSLPSGMPVGFVVDWIQTGAGILTFATAAGAAQTVNSPEGLRSGGLYGRGTLEVVATNTWNLSGYTQV